MAKIYISSTYEDLKKERGAAAQAIRRLGHQPVYMEDYVAGPQRPLEKCLQDVRSCDIYIGIFAWRYGFIPDRYAKSITHLEYEAANKVGIPCLIFLLDQKAPWPVEHVDGESRNIDQLRKKLKNDHIVSFFKNADELSSKVSPAVSNLISNSRKPGKEMEEVSTASKSIAIGIQETGKEKLIGQGDHEPRPRPNTNKAEILTGRNEALSEVPQAKKVYKNKQGFTEADYGDGIIMVYIPPGEFNMGCNDYKHADEGPLHTVYLDGYWMGKFEVTLAQYNIFVSDTGHQALPSYVSNYSHGDNHPVVGVSWEDADAYCKWLSGKLGVRSNFKLPTEAQWEKAARGTDMRKYPWGNNRANKTLANFNSRFESTTSVGSYPKGASPFGLLDMAGNVWEWCRDWYDKNYYQSSPDKNPNGPKSGTSRVMRGGGWVIYAVYLRCSDRVNGNPSNRNFYVGFRLCQDS